MNRIIQCDNAKVTRMLLDGANSGDIEAGCVRIT